MTCKSGDLPNKHPSRTTRYGQDGGQISVMVNLYTVAGNPFLDKYIEGGINAQTASYPNNT